MNTCNKFQSSVEKVTLPSFKALNHISKEYNADSIYTHFVLNYFFLI